LLDEGKSQEAVSRLQGILQRAPTPRLWELLGDAYNQIHDLPKAEQAYRQAAEAQPDDTSITKNSRKCSSPRKISRSARTISASGADGCDDPRQLICAWLKIYRQMKQLDKAEQNVLLAKQRAPNAWK